MIKKRIYLILRDIKAVIVGARENYPSHKHCANIRTGAVHSVPSRCGIQSTVEEYRRIFLTDTLVISLQSNFNPRGLTKL